jgi:hypothetical protein
MRFFPVLLLWMVLASTAGVCSEPVVRVETQGVLAVDQKTFWNELSLVARKAAALGKKRFSRIKSINDSYQLTAEAIGVLAQRGDVPAAVPLLKKASKKYDGNRMAYLLLGAAFESIGDKANAASAYASFYRYSLTYVPFEQELIGPPSLQIFRGYVEKRFSEWGMTLPSSRVSLELQKMRSLIMLESSKAGQWINLLLPILVVVGLALMLLGRMGHAEFPPAVSYFLGGFYLLLVLGYFLWVAHFFIGLPFLISVGTEYAIFFGVGTLLIGLFYAANRFLDSKYRREPPHGEAKTCLHCHATMVRIAVECPVCKRPCCG